MADEVRMKGILAYPVKKTTDYSVKAIILFAAKIILVQNRVKKRLAAKIQPRQKPAKINSIHKLTLKGTVKMLRMVNWSTTSAAKIIKKINGVLTVPLLHFEGGRNFVKKLPLGEAAVELSVSIGKIIAALKFGTKEVLKDFAAVTASLMFSRYGEDAALVTTDYMEASSHILHILWNALQILDPLNLPLDHITGFHELYVDTGIDYINQEIKMEIGINWPEGIVDINNVAALESLAIEEKKKKAIVA